MCSLFLYIDTHVESSEEKIRFFFYTFLSSFAAFKQDSDTKSMLKTQTMLVTRVIDKNLPNRKSFL